CPLRSILIVVLAHLRPHPYIHHLPTRRSSDLSFSTAEQTEKKLLLLSNFKDGFDISAINSNLNVDTYVIPLTPQKQNNISIDSLFYTRLAPGDGTLTVILSYTGEDPGKIGRASCRERV